MGLYLINHVIPGCQVSGAYAQAVVAQGYGVLPIIVPGNTAPTGEDQVGALQAWGAPPCPTMFDIEQFSEPSPGWIDAEIGQQVAAGYFPGMYGPGADQARYSGDPWRWRCLADWTYVPEILPPYQAQQWTNNAFGPSGYQYDLTQVVDDLLMWGMRPSPQPKPVRKGSGDNEMWQSGPLTGTFDGTGVNVLTPDGRDINGSPSPEQPTVTWVYVKALDGAGFTGTLFWTRLTDGVPAVGVPINLAHGAQAKAAAPIPFEGGFSVVPNQSSAKAPYSLSCFRSAYA